MSLEPVLSVLGLAAGTALCLALWTCIYRLFFHPLAKFPGPKLAAITTWYEAYYDFIGYQGQYTFLFEDLHKKYGALHNLTPRSPSLAAAHALTPRQAPSFASAPTNCTSRIHPTTRSCTI
jgi:hypothetical protein